MTPPLLSGGVEKWNYEPVPAGWLAWLRASSYCPARYSCCRQRKHRPEQLISCLYSISLSASLPFSALNGGRINYSNGMAVSACSSSILLSRSSNRSIPHYSINAPTTSSPCSPFANTPQAPALPTPLLLFQLPPPFGLVEERQEGAVAIPTAMVGFCGGGGVPNWLASLLAEETFFQPCTLHEAARKNERNVFCLDCCSSLCPQCIHSHRSHRLLQIRRYVYHDVIRLDDLGRLLDCSFVQSYITNSAKVVFINQRQQTRPFRISGHICTICDRPLQDSYRFCSVACKVHHLLRSEGSMARYLYDCQFLPLPSPSDLDDGQLTPDSVLDSPSSPCGVVCNVLPDVVVRKKRTSHLGTSGEARPAELPQRPGWCGEATTSRRKGAPSRSPLY